MPIYSYVCDVCGHHDDEYMRMKDADHLLECPKCLAPAYKKQVTSFGSSVTPFQKPIEMYSVAVQKQDEIRELQRQCPDAKISDDPRDPLYGVPVAPNRQAKKQVLKASGYIERK